jgi:zinc transport system substrate-binding protein
MKKVLSSAFLLLLVLASAASAEPVQVFVSILPQKYFVGQIGGERVNVSALVEKGKDPHAFEPLPAQMAGLSKAKAYFAIGLPFEEELLSRVERLNPGLKVFHTDRGIDKITGGHRHEEAGHEHGHTHGGHEKDHHGHGHGSEGADPHVWNGPREAVHLAGKILAGLIEIDPDGKSEYTKRHDEFVRRLGDMDAEFSNLFRGKQGAAFLVFHPAWAYFARSYGLVEVAIETDGKEPKAADLAGVINRARERGVRVIFISPQFSRRSAEIVAQAIGAVVETVNPLAEEWEENLRAVAAAISEAAK